LVCPLFIRTTAGAELVENPVPAILVILIEVELYPYVGVILVIVGAATIAVIVRDTVLVALSETTTLVCVASRYPLFCNNIVCDPAGIFSMVAGVTLPVLVPFSNIVAPVGTELTEIFPTADTAHGSNSRSNNAPVTRVIFFMADFLVVKTNKNTIAPAFDKFY
jgi:hypothetical protein